MPTEAKLSLISQYLRHMQQKKSSSKRLGLAHVFKIVKDEGHALFAFDCTISKKFRMASNCWVSNYDLTSHTAGQ